tara:strand:+ start:31 stop:792 length:762 start_codon:yes stop_codon:yes gene_type:complete
MNKEIKMTFGKERDGSIEQTRQEEMNYARFSGQQWLSEYPNKVKNSFNEIYQSQMKELKGKYIKIRSKYQSLDKYDDDDHFNFIDSEQYFEDQLFALSEMNIIYIFKEFEINLKSLLMKVYGNDDRNLYKWDKLKSYFKSKKISISEIDGYEEVKQLKELNNHLKHSNRPISGEIKNIKEFKEENFLTEEMINKFFERIKSYPHIFLQNIVGVIYTDLYEFDEERIKQLAKEMAQRMENKDAKLYIDEILKLY